MKAIHWVFKEKDRLIATYDQVRKNTLSTDVLEKSLDEHIEKMRELATRIDRSLARNASIACDQDEFNRQYEKLTSQYNAEKEKVENLKMKIRDMNLRRAKADAFIKHLADLDGPVEIFSPFLWTSLCDGLVVHSPTDIRVVLKNGEEIKSTPIL